MLPENELERKMAISVVRSLKERNGDRLIQAVAQFMQRFDMTCSDAHIRKIPISRKIALNEDEKSVL